ncbi:VC0807 family protein [Bacillus songklensis]|uniref:VC0807 family protein n=1 Tax=Bacillus songklensis TaxID=1069116 RepID=A0ABV8B5J5_9BACI
MEEQKKPKQQPNVLFDLIFYIALPYLIWNQGRHLIGDYYAILLSTAPAFFYTIYKFIKERQFNITGIFIVVSLLARTIIDLVSGKAQTMLYNQVYFMFGLALFFFVTVIVNRPMGMYFFGDTAQLMGYERKDIMRYLKEKDMFKMLRILTILFSIRYAAVAVVKLWLINQYGVDGYGKMIVIMQVINWIFTILLGIYSYMIIRKLQGKTGDAENPNIHA